MTQSRTPPTGFGSEILGPSAEDLAGQLDRALDGAPPDNPPAPTPAPAVITGTAAGVLTGILKAWPRETTLDEPPGEAEDEDVLVLDETLEVRDPDEDAVLLLDDSLVAQPPEPVEDAPPLSEEPGDPEPPPAPVDHPLVVLLADPPAVEDLSALDMLYALWPRGTAASTDPRLLDVAKALARHFGLPTKLPMTSSRAWRMLDPGHFEADFAEQLATTADFIHSWQHQHDTFLILDFGEIDLVECLFEALHPGRHAELLAAVMDFKVLSNRRLGLIRRIPTRIRRTAETLAAAGDPQAAMVELAHAKALLERITAAPSGFAPIVEAAVRAAEDVEKMMRKIAAASLPPDAATKPPGGGLTLGRLGS